MLWSLAVAVCIISAILYLCISPEAAASLNRGKDDNDKEYDDDQSRKSGQDAWKARVKVCDKTAKARDRLRDYRRRITKAQKEIHNLKKAAIQVHMQAIMISANVSSELVDHHSSGQAASPGQSPSYSSMQQQISPQQKNRTSSQELKPSKSRRKKNSKTCSSCVKRRSTTKTITEGDYVSGSFKITFEDYIDKLISNSPCAEIWRTECCSSNQVVEKFFRPPEESEFDGSGVSELDNFKKRPVYEISEVKLETRDNWQDTELDEVENKDTEISESFELLIRGEKGTSTTDIPTSKTVKSDQTEKITSEDVLIREPQETGLKSETKEDEAKPSANVTVQDNSESSSVNFDGKKHSQETELKSETENDEAKPAASETVKNDLESSSVEFNETKDPQILPETLNNTTTAETRQYIADSISRIGTELIEQIRLLLQKLMESYLPEREDRPLEKVVINQVFIIDEEEKEHITEQIPSKQEINEQNEIEQSPFPPIENSIDGKASEAEPNEDATEDVKELQEPMVNATEDIKESQEEIEKPSSEGTPRTSKSTSGEQSTKDQSEL